MTFSFSDGSFNIQSPGSYHILEVRSQLDSRTETMYVHGSPQPCFCQHFNCISDHVKKKKKILSQCRRKHVTNAEVTHEDNRVTPELHTGEATFYTAATTEG